MREVSQDNIEIHSITQLSIAATLIVASLHRALYQSQNYARQRREWYAYACLYAGIVLCHFVHNRSI
jgi:hypothetical protein